MMRAVVLGLTASLAVLASARADAGPVTFVDLHAPVGGITIDPTNTSYDFWHSILAPSEGSDSYDPLTDVLDDASLELTFSNSTQGNDRVSVTLSNFNASLSNTVAHLTGGFGPALLFDVQIAYLAAEGERAMTLSASSTATSRFDRLLKETNAVAARHPTNPRVVRLVQLLSESRARLR